MNRYLIEHKIKTLAHVWAKCITYDGYEFRQWDRESQDKPNARALISHKSIDAQTVNDAIYAFREGLFRLVDRIAFLSQCYTSTEVQPFMIVRENDNSEKILYLYYSKESEGVPLGFSDREIEGLKKLESYTEKGDVFRYIREAANASSYYARLMMLISALEAIAGEKTGTKFKQTDKNYIRDHVLKDSDLYDKIYKYGDGIRNRLLHGGKVDLSETEHRDIDYVDKIYKAIVRYFNENYGTAINTKVVKPLRSPYGNYEVYNLWLKPKEMRGALDLKTVIAQFTEQYVRNGKPNNSPAPEHFEIVGMPQNY